MIPSGAWVWIAMGHTDMRRGMQSLAAQVQQHFFKDQFAGDLWVFRSRSGSLVKIIWHDGIGMSLYAKLLEKARFFWPSAKDGVVSLTTAQSDQGFGGDAAFDNTSRCRGLDDRALAGAASIARPAGDHDPERGRHDVKPFGNIFADLAQPAATAWAGLVVDIDDLLDPLEVRRQRTAVGLAGTIALGLSCSSRTGCAKCRLDILKAKLELIGIKLLGLAAETVAHERIDDRLQPLDLCVSFALGNRHVSKLAGLLERQRT